MRRFIVFSVVLLLIILIFAAVAFVLSMRNVVRTSNGNELTRMLEIERIKLETSVNNEIVIAMNYSAAETAEYQPQSTGTAQQSCGELNPKRLKMASSPLIKHFFMNPEDSGLKEIALDEIFVYCAAFESGSVFWINAIDMLFHLDESIPYLLDPSIPENYWYNMTLTRPRYTASISITTPI